MPWPVLLVEVQGSRQTKWWRCISKNLRKPGSWWTTSYKRIVSLLVSPTANEAAGYLLVPLILCMRQSNKMMLTSLPNSFYLEQIQTVRTSGGILPTTMLGKPVMTSRWFLKSMPVAPRFPKKPRYIGGSTAHRLAALRTFLPTWSVTLLCRSKVVRKSGCSSLDEDVWEMIEQPIT